MIRWSRVAKLPSLIRRRNMGWPRSSPANGATLSISEFELMMRHRSCSNGFA